MATDTFGITMLYPTKSGGRTWTSSWHNGKSRSFRNTLGSYELPPTTGVNQDPEDLEFLEMGGSADPTMWHIDGLGTARWHQEVAGSGGIRVYIIDYPSNGSESHEIADQIPARNTWTNVEMTAYWRLQKINPVFEGVDHGQVRLAARSNHFNIQWCNCDGKGYHWQLYLEPTSESSTQLSKEIIHDTYASRATDGISASDSCSSYSRVSKTDRVPVNKWVGMKFVLRTITSSGNVKLEGWRDLSFGKNGGKWVKLNEYTDTGVAGSWGALSAGKIAELDAFWASPGGCGMPGTTECIEDPTPYVGNYNPRVTRAGYGCYFRHDGQAALVEAKYWSIREIDPL